MIKREKLLKKKIVNYIKIVTLNFRLKINSISIIDIVNIYTIYI